MKKLAERSNYDLKKVVSKSNGSLSFDNLFGTNIAPEDIINILNSAKDDTAPGFDRMSIKLLKYVIDYIINPLVYIYNLSVQQGIFPDFLKLAVIKQIFKGGDNKQVKNFRPISLLSNFAKIFEKII